LKNTGFDDDAMRDIVAHLKVELSEIKQAVYLTGVFSAVTFALVLYMIW